MREREHKQLLSDVEELRRLLADYSTETIVGACTAYWLKRGATDEVFQDLISPAKQWSFLLGLMLTSPEPCEPKKFADHTFANAQELLNRIFSAYAWAYFAEPGEVVTEEWVRVREVAMPAFLHYFNQGLLASTDQVEQRIQRYLSPFDAQLLAELGLSASRAVEICRWITAKLQSSIDALTEAAGRERRARLELLNRMVCEGWDLERLRSETQQSDYRDLALGLLSGIAQFSYVSLAELTEHFGAESATTFWSLFSIARAEIGEFTYPTEMNLAEQRSLYRVDDNRAMCPLANQLFLAVLARYESHLAAGTARESFFRRRDKILEQEVELHFRNLLGSAGVFCPSVFETPHQQYEHDLVVRLGRTVLVVEAKASPPVEPFRDPDLAFTRIRRAFRSERGIQSAFNQAKRLWNRWAAGDRVRLFDRDGKVACEFDSTNVDEVFIVCATRDNFGLLATDLSLLLEKQDQEPYPWCVNALDAEAIADAWHYFKWDSPRFVEFLRQRVQLHGRLMSFDELEVVGFFIAYGGLHWIVDSPGNRIELNPNYSNMFDRIYRVQMGGPPMRYEPSEPFLSDLRESLRQGKPVPVQPQARRTAKKQGRNEPCAYGSGRKYKRCCGR